MLESAAEGKFDYIITKSAKRVSRNTIELLQIMRYLKERGIQMYFEIENVNSFDPDAEVAITLSGAMGQRKQKPERKYSVGIQRKFEEGYLAASNILWGIPVCGRGIGNSSEQAKIVELIIELYLKGYTFSQIKNIWRKGDKNGNRYGLQM